VIPVPAGVANVAGDRPHRHAQGLRRLGAAGARDAYCQGVGSRRAIISTPSKGERMSEKENPAVLRAGLQSQTVTFIPDSDA
jgi:hypothetical protein